MKSKFKISSLFILFACFALSASAQFPSYGSNVSPSSVQWGGYANQPALFDSSGALNVPGTQCVACNAVVYSYKKAVTLTHAQLVAIHSTPDTLLYAQGTGKLIGVISAYITLNYGSAVFTADSVLNITQNGAIVASNTDAINAGSTLTGQFKTGITANGLSPNTPLLITSATANLAGGTSSTATITFTYEVLNVAAGVLP